MQGDRRRARRMLPLRPKMHCEATVTETELNGPVLELSQPASASGAKLEARDAGIKTHEASTRIQGEVNLGAGGNRLSSLGSRPC